MIGPGWVTADQPHLLGDIYWLNRSQLPGEYTGVMPRGEQSHVLPRGAQTYVTTLGIEPGTSRTPGECSTN